MNRGKPKTFFKYQHFICTMCRGDIPIFVFHIPPLDSGWELCGIARVYGIPYTRVTQKNFKKLGNPGTAISGR